MSTKHLVFALSLASAAALVAGLFVASDVRASALESGTELPVEVTDVVAASVDPSMIDQARAYEGMWVYVGGQKERDGIDAAITASMDAVSPMIRGIGTRRLKESNPVPSRISIDLNGEDVTIAFDGDRNKARLDGPAVKGVSPQGDKMKVSHKVKGDKLIQFIDGGGGDRHNHFRLNADGTRMTLDVKITSGHLPVPCKYRLSFKRK